MAAERLGIGGLAALLATVTLLSACGSSSDEGGTTAASASTSASEATSQAATSETCLEAAPADGRAVAGTVVKDSLRGVKLTYVSYGGPHQAAIEKHGLQPFAECSGAEILNDQPTSMAKLKAMVDAGEVSWDVVYGAGRAVAMECGRLVERVDRSKVDLSDIPTQFSECDVPFHLVSDYPVYNTDAFPDDPPRTWADFFDAEKYPGKRLVNGSPDVSDAQLVVGAARALGYTRDELQEDLPWDRALEKLTSFKDNLVYYQSAAQQQQILEQGEVVMASATANVAYEAAKNGAPYLPMFGDVFVTAPVEHFVPRGAKNPDASFALINYLSGPEQQAAYTEDSIIPPANLRAERRFTDEAQPFIPPQDVLDEFAVNVRTPFWLEPTTTDEVLETTKSFIVG